MLLHGTVCQTARNESLGGDDTRVERVDPDFARTQFLAEDLRDSVNSGFAG
jgi:hypothetical protein